MSLNLLREANKSLQRGISLETTRRCENDNESRRSTRSDTVLKLLRKSNINCNVREFGEIVGTSDKSLFSMSKRGDVKRIEGYINDYKTRMLDDRLKSEGVVTSEFRDLLDCEYHEVWNENDDSLLKEWINEYRNITGTCVSGI